MELKQLIHSAIKKLKPVTESPEIEALVLLEYLLNIKKEKLINKFNEPVDKEIASKFKQLINKRCIQRKPLAYLTNNKEFFSLDFFVNNKTLIPRPETEIIVETALEFLKDKKEPKILDIGTGCGNIIISIAKNLNKNAGFYATDISTEAIFIARKNAERHLTKVIFFVSDLISSTKNKKFFDLIVANPPYVSIYDYKDLQEEIKHEPKIALISKNKGLYHIFNILDNYHKILKKRGKLIIEIGVNQAEILKKKKKNIKFISDIYGKSRIVEINDHK